MSTGSAGRLATILKPRRTAIVLAIATGLVDQVTKLWIVSSIALGEVRPVVPRVMELTHSLNPGGVWGIGQDVAPAVRFVTFLVLPMFITIFAGWYSVQLPASARRRHAAVGLVVGGALGNLVDRVVRGHVVDFLRVHLGSFAWPDFNVADSAICVGVAVLVVAALFDRDDDTAGDGAPG